VDSFGDLKAWARWLGAVVVPPCHCVRYISPRTMESNVQVKRSQINDSAAGTLASAAAAGASGDPDADHYRDAVVRGVSAANSCMHHDPAGIAT
jgi:hypothetical protein